jgi:transcriptional regulator with XRE-family HTH domain
MIAHSTVMSAGHGGTIISAGAKKKPAPRYHAEPARSDFSTKLNHRGTWGSAGACSRDCIVVSSGRRTAADTSSVRLSGKRDNYLAGSGSTPIARETEPVSTVQTQHPPFGSLMKQWRQRRRLSQLDLAIEADVSSRHVSFIETGRSAPSRAMVLRLAAALDVPLRERNQLLMAAGLAPAYAERSLDDPDMAPVRDGIAAVLRAYEPFPCLAVDRGWNIVAANSGAAVMMRGVATHLLDRPNALRISLHPEGLAPRIRNLGQWRHHVIGRLRRAVAVSGSDELAELLAEIDSYPGGFDDDAELGGVAVPLELDGPGGTVLTFLSTVTTFGTAVDLTAAELSIEAFLPADEATAAALR